MLALRDEETFVVFIVFFFVAVVVWISNRAKYRSERLKLIERALQSGNLDPQMRTELYRALTDRSDAQWLQALGQHLAFLARNLLFIGGWIAMFIGGGIVLVAWLSGNSYGYREGIMTALVGFAVATVPLALRELDSKRARQGS